MLRLLFVPTTGKGILMNTNRINNGLPIDSTPTRDLADLTEVELAAREYEKVGWVLVPIFRGHKGPGRAGWDRLDRCQIPEYWEGNMGLVHAHSGTCAVDVDDVPAARAFLAGHGADLDALLDAPDSVRVESGNEGHAKLLYALPFPMPSAKHVVANGDGKRHDVLNFRCATAGGGTAMQDVLPPSWHPSGSRYQWAGRGDWRNLPPLPPALYQVWSEMLPERRERPVGAPGGHDDATPDRARAIEALSFLDPDMDMVGWVRVGMALKAAGGEFEDWAEWSEKGAKAAENPPGSLEVRWASFDAEGDVGPGTLFWLAKEAGWVPPELRRPSIEEMFGAEPGEAPGCGVPAGAGVPPPPPMPDPADTPEAVKQGFSEVTPQTPVQGVRDLFMRAALLDMSKLEIEPAINAIVQQKQFTRGALNAELKSARAAVVAEQKKRRAAAAKEKGTPALGEAGAGDDPVSRRFPELNDPDRWEKVGKMIQHSMHCKVNSPGDGGDAGGDDLASVLPLLANVETALLYGCGHIYPPLRFNDLRMTAETLDGQPLDDDFIHKLRSIMSHDFKVNFAKDDVHNAVQLQAKRSSYHPVREYLDGLEWDGFPRVCDWVVRLLGAEDTAYHRAVGGLLICGAVQRAMRPGSKFDYMPILEGRQGMTKSMTLRALVPNEAWFLDITVDPRDLDKTSLAIRGGLVMEVGELSGVGKADQNSLKQWVSRQSDHFRAPYDRIAKDWPRQGIFVGTTNEDRYLTDTTGNRRFLPLACGEINLDALVAERDQLWAEATFMMKTSPSAWHLFQGIEALAEEEQEDRREQDPGEELIAHYLAIKTKVTTTELCSALCVNDTTRVAGRRVRAIMRTQKDWEGPKKIKVGKVSVRGYFRIGELDESEINFPSPPDMPHGARH